MCQATSLFLWRSSLAPQTRPPTAKQHGLVRKLDCKISTSTRQLERIALEYLRIRLVSWRPLRGNVKVARTGKIVDLSSSMLASKAGELSVHDGSIEQ